MSGRARAGGHSFCSVCGITFSFEQVLKVDSVIINAVPVNSSSTTAT